MGDWLRHLALRAKARTGFGPQLIVCGLIALVSLILALGFLCIALYVSLARSTGPVTAGLLLAGVFLLIAILAAVTGEVARRRNIERARLALAARSGVGWLDPKFLSIGIEIGRTLGWRRLMMLAAAGLLAAGLGKEWSAAGKKKDPKPE